MATLRQYLLSKYVDENGEPIGYSTTPDIYGDFHHYNDVIDHTYKTVFQNMRLRVTIDDDFKKEFCKRFYVKQIGFETFAPFFLHVETMLNNECFNLFKLRDEIRNMIPEDMLKTTDVWNIGHYEGTSDTDQTSNSETNAKQDNDTLQIQSNTPEKDTSIIYPNKEGYIKNASALGETHGKNEGNSKTDNKADSHTKNKSDTTNHSIGYVTRPRFEMMNLFARFTDVNTQIFNIIEQECFLQIFES